LIQGSGDDGYRPEFIFGKPNSFIYQRVFGEIHLEGFEVSHTKDGFQWDENEQPFLELLKENINSDDMPLLLQAREFRVSRSPIDYHAGAEAATSRTAHSIKEYVPPVIDMLSQAGATKSPLPTSLKKISSTSKRIIDIETKNNKWRIIIELICDPAIGDWLSISDNISESEKNEAESEGFRCIALRLSLTHPFMERFSGTDCDQIEPLLRLACAMGIAEVIARDSGVRMAGTIRKNVNELLRNALWRT
jgi:hypothetical protein